MLRYRSVFAFVSISLTLLPNRYRPAGAVHCERGRYAGLKGWLAVQIDAEFFIQFIEQGAYNLCFIVFVKGGGISN
jgi:hypothetical protein